MAAVVFDASAILALLRDEPGADIVARHVGDGLISAVNFQEIVKELLRRGVPIEAALDLLDALHLDIRPHGHQEAWSNRSRKTLVHRKGAVAGRTLPFLIEDGDGYY